MPRRVVPLPIPPGPACLQALPALRAALDGSGPAVAPYAGGPGAVPPALTLHGSDGLPDDLAVVVGTSGSTGTAKLAMLGADALAASAAATAERLGGPADWVLALPPQHIAGLQVLLRALAWGTQVDVLPDDPLRPEGFAAALAARRHAPGGYISLVPTQLGRLLRDERAADALAGFAAVLLGGAACPPALLEAARSAGIAVVTSYGASETCGGCVYDGEPLACAQVFLEDPDASGAGRVLLAGEMVAHGYLGDPGRTASCFPTRDGRRVFRSDDVGTWDVPTGGGAPRLAVLGRADDIIVTGGYKVAPRLVQDAVAAALPGWDCLALGVPDPEWGQAVAVALAPATGEDGAGTAPSLPGLRAILRGTLPPYALPHRLRVLPALPQLGIGKPDLAAVRAEFAARP